MKSVVTLTMNPAIDKSASVDVVASEIKLRCGTPARDPGGGGINVSRAIMKMGGTSRAMYPAGGFTGHVLTDLLSSEGVETVPVPIQGITRENFTVFEETSSLQYRFGMPGATLDDAEQDACLSALREQAPDYIVASGSLPPGIADDFYVRVDAIARETGAKLVLDTSGAPLKASLNAGKTHVLKPNMRELQQLVGRDIKDEREQEAAVRQLIDNGQAEIVVVSLGAAGVLYMTAEHKERVRSPNVPIKSKVGAGDSMVAGIVFALASGDDVPYAVRRGVAAGSAAVMTPGTQLCRAEDVERLYAHLVAEM